MKETELHAMMLRILSQCIMVDGRKQKPEDSVSALRYLCDQVEKFSSLGLDADVQHTYAQISYIALADLIRSHAFPYSFPYSKEDNDNITTYECIRAVESSVKDIEYVINEINKGL